MIKSSSDRFLVDGFPRALDQAETFERDIMPCQMVRCLTHTLPHIAMSFAMLFCSYLVALYR